MSSTSGPGAAASQARPGSKQSPLLVHVHITRTAGSTLNHILRSSYGARHCPAEPWDSRWGPAPFSNDDLRKLRRLYPRLRSIAGHRLFGYVDLGYEESEAAHFALIRDPVSACAARFQFKVEYDGKQMSEFESWIQRDWTRNRHTKAIVGSDDVEAAKVLIRSKGIFLGLTERFEASVLLLKGLVAPDLNISHQPVNVARRRVVSEQLLSDERTRSMIVEAQASDLELYRYVKEELWAEYVDAYGPDFMTDLEKFQADSGSFNQRNIFLSRLKAHAVYKPALAVHRMKISRSAVGRLPVS